MSLVADILVQVACFLLLPEEFFERFGSLLRVGIDLESPSSGHHPYWLFVGKLKLLQHGLNTVFGNTSYDDNFFGSFIVDSDPLYGWEILKEIDAGYGLLE